MILTCPECATSYFVDDDRIPAGGRSVKCSNCGARWQAAREDAQAQSDPTQPMASEVEDGARREPEPDVGSTLAPTDAAQELVSNETTSPVIDRPVSPRRGPVRAAAPTNVAVARAVGLGVAIVALASLIAAGIGLREKIVARWPSAGGFYAAIGLAVNDLGLVIEEVRAAPAFEGGHPVLTVSGVIRNLRNADAEAPALEVNLLDKAGKRLSHKTARPVDSNIPALERRHFALSLVDPPADLHDLEVRFEDADAGRPEPVKTPVAPGDHHG